MTTDITAARLCKWVRPGEQPHPLPPHKRRDAEYCDSTCRAEATVARRAGREDGQEALRSAGKPLTQRDRVLFELRNAGEGGVRSDVFLRLAIPRAAARVKELRDEGYEIESVHDNQYVRYILRREPGRLVGVASTSPYSAENEFA